VPEADSGFARDVVEMESEFTRRPPIRDEIERVAPTLVDIVTEATEASVRLGSASGDAATAPGNAAVAYFSTHLRSTMIICNDDWAWMTVTLPRWGR
jgi:hypothetical protein